MFATIVCLLILAWIVGSYLRKRAQAKADAVSGLDNSKSVDASTEGEEDMASKTAEQLLVEATELYKEFNYDEARDMFDEALEQAEETHGFDDPLVAQILMGRGEADWACDGEDYDEDTRPTEFLAALSILEKQHGPSSAELLPALQKLVAFYDFIGRHDKAERMLYRMEKIQHAA
jgi:tetratricopeptide (TPR) repeat protein